MAARNIILIAGMHRSGTSVLTRAINLAGVPLPSNLKPASPDVNAEGFWEPLEIKRFHDEILSSLKSSWNDPREIPLEWFDSPPFQKFRAWLMDWIEKEIGGNDMLVVKDPRVCRLLPLWQKACDALGVGVHSVIIVRNPVEVARSLAKRDRFPEAQSLVLWLRHFIDPERFTRHGSRSFVTYDQLMHERLATIRRIGAELGLTFAVPDSELRAELEDAVKDSLRHHVATEADLAQAEKMVPPVATAWHWAQAAAAGKSPDPSALDAITDLLRKLERGPAASSQTA